MSSLVERYRACPCSVELWPARTSEQARRLDETLEVLRDLAPAFVSVTYGAFGSSRAESLELVARVREVGLPVLAHLAVAGHSLEELDALLARIGALGAAGVLALRGDPPLEADEPAQHLFQGRHALELVELARRRTCLEVAVALHPQGHPDSVSLEEDLVHQATKLAASDFGVTQFFFELAAYESLVAALARRGARRPVIPGLLVPRSLRQLERMGEMARVRPSERLVRVLSDGDGAGAREVILELALGALREGAPGVHLFSMNQPGVTAWLLEQLAAHYPRGSSFTQSSCDGKSAVTTTPARGSPVLPD